MRWYIPAIALLILNGCIQHGEIRQIIWDQSGKKIYFVRRRLTPTLADFRVSHDVYQSLPDLSFNRALIRGTLVDTLMLSPDNRYLLVVQHLPGNTMKNILQLYSLAGKKIFLSRIFNETPWPMRTLWLPDSRHYSYTDNAGIFIASIKDNTTKIILSNSGWAFERRTHYGLSWSRDGKFLSYFTQSRKDAENSLSLYDPVLKTSRKLHTSKKGLFREAVFTADRKHILYTLHYGKETHAGLYEQDLATGKRKLLYRGREYLQHLATAHNDEIVLFTEQVSITNYRLVSYDRQSGKSSIIHRLLFGRCWAVHGQSGRILITDPETGKYLIEKKLPRR